MGFICFTIRPTYSQAAEVVESWYCHMLTGTRANTSQSEGIHLDPQVPEKSSRPHFSSNSLHLQHLFLELNFFGTENGKAVMTD